MTTNGDRGARGSCALLDFTARGMRDLQDWPAGPTEHNSRRSSQCVLLRKALVDRPGNNSCSRTETVSSEGRVETRLYKGLKRIGRESRFRPTWKELMQRSISPGDKLVRSSASCCGYSADSSCSSSSEDGPSNSLMPRANSSKRSSTK